MARLEVCKIRSISGDGVELSPSKSLTIGRSSSNDVPLRDTKVSRKHCIIEFIDGVPYIRDVGSQKGTYVNGQKIGPEPVALKHGDRIKIRPFELVFDQPESIPKDDFKDRLAAAEQRVVEVEQSAEHRRKEMEQQIAAMEIKLQNARQESADGMKLIEEKDREIAALNTSADSLRAQVSKIETQAGKDASVAAQTIQDLRRDLERLRLGEAALQRQMGESESARHAAETQARRATELFGEMHRQLEVVEEAGHLLELIQDRLSDAESAWAEIDRDVDIDAEVSPEQVEAVATLRQHLSTQLITLNSQRDEAVSNLRNLLIALRVLIHRYGPVETIHVMSESPSRMRKWLGLGAAKR